MNNLAIENILTQQFIDMSRMVVPSMIMNPPNSLIEPMTQYAGTKFYNNSDNVPNGSVSIPEVAGTYLAGYINPSTLKFNYHGNGTEYLDPLNNQNSAVYAFGTWTVKADGPGVSTYPANNLATAATITSNSNVYNEPLSGIVDENTGTGSLAEIPFPWFKFELAEAKVVKEYLMSGYRAGLSDWQFKDWELQGSNNNTDWTTLDTRHCFLVGGTLYRFSINNNTAYLYYRLQSLAGDRSEGLCEFGLYENKTLDYPYYDTTNFAINSSLKLLAGYQLLGSTSGYGTLGNSDWHFRGFFSFSDISNTIILLGMENFFRIQATSSGLEVVYTVDGVNYVTVSSSAISWSTDTFYYISVRRTGNTLYFYVDDTAYGTEDLTGITFFGEATTYIIGDASASVIINIEEVEFLVGETTSDTPPTSIRTAIHIPAIAWTSAPEYIQSNIQEIDVVLYQDVLQFASYGVPVFGTDCTFSVSLDNGSTFGTITMTRAGNLNSAIAVYRGFADVSGLTNTNQLVYKIESDADKCFKFDGLSLYWRDANDSIALTTKNLWDYTKTELASIPTSTSSLADKLVGIYEYLFHKRTITASTETLYKDNESTVLGSSSLSDNGTVVTKSKIQ